MELPMDPDKYFDNMFSVLIGKIEGVEKSLNSKIDEVKTFYQGNIEAFKENTSIHIENLKDKNKTFEKYHNDHYKQTEENKADIAKIPQQITAARESIREEIMAKSRWNAGTVISIIAAISAIAAVIVTIV